MSTEFVIQIHSDYGPLHYDLMLERGEVLVTWQLSFCPSELTEGDSAGAKKLPDHRREYLSHEGPVSKGRGEVAIFDKGTYDLLEESENRWKIRLRGRILAGTFELRSSDESGNEWTLARLPAGKGCT